MVIFTVIACIFLHYGRRSATSEPRWFQKPELASPTDLTLEEKKDFIQLKRAGNLKHDGIGELDTHESFELEARRMHMSSIPVELE
jgi:hypothetical protein